jgi:hypothetical protein
MDILLIDKFFHFISPITQYLQLLDMLLLMIKGKHIIGLGVIFINYT